MFSYSSNLFVYTTDATMGSVCEIYLYDIRDLEAPVRVIPIEGSRISAAVWGPFDEFLVTGHENGAICRYDVTRSGHCLQSVKEHKALISDLQASSDQIMIVTASKDNTSKLMDSENLEVLKTYRTERPVNSAAISPLKDHVVLGGGQEAREVTTTTTKAGKFDARFYHLIYEEEIGRVKGHFGPINSLRFHPDGKSYSSGGEDGYVRVHTFDSSYFEFEF
jgi:translation initiation factor 3 subunit I